MPSKPTSLDRASGVADLAAGSTRVDVAAEVAVAGRRSVAADSRLAAEASVAAAARFATEVAVAAEGPTAEGPAEPGGAVVSLIIAEPSRRGGACHSKLSSSRHGRVAQLVHALPITTRPPAEQFEMITYRSSKGPI